ncbi:UNVERIFIED_ORG: hypothetical protein J2X79_004251 [Arthrobacter globiformis]|nr:hypothetical protein [Arthrobacter globiformis]
MAISVEQDGSETTEKSEKKTPKPNFPLADQTNRAWREQTLTRIAEMRTLADCFIRDDEDLPKPLDKEQGGPAREAARQRNQDLDKAIHWHLSEASDAAKGKTRMRELPQNGAVIERAMSNIDAAEAALLRRAPEQYLRGQMHHLWAHVRQHLPSDDPRRAGMEELMKPGSWEDPSETARESIVQAVRAASSEARREFTRVRSFRNLVLLSAVLMTLIAAAVACWGWVTPGHLALCFSPKEQPGPVCPTGGQPHESDLLLVEFVGLVAAAVSGATSLHNATGSATRLGLPVALAILKLPTGALTAFLGLMLMRGGFVPGLSALDSPPQILAWAIVFGAGQQLVTGLIDRQANNVLNQVAGKA